MLIKLRTISGKKKKKDRYLKYNLDTISTQEMIETESNAKQNASDVLSGGYNKQYSQPSKDELKELEKDV